MFCRNCGNELETGAKFCAKCGQAVFAENACVDKQYMPEQKSTQKKKNRIVSAVLVIVILLLVAGIGGFFLRNSAENQYTRVMARANEFYVAEEYEDAVEAYSFALEYKSDSKDASNGIVRSYIKLAENNVEDEDFEEALNIYKRALGEEDNEKALTGALECYKRLAERYGTNGNYDMANKYVDDYKKLYYEYNQSYPEISYYGAESIVGVESIQDDNEPEVVWPSEDIVNEPVNDPTVSTINVWAYTDEVPNMIQKYVDTHPDFPYMINCTIIATTDGEYTPALERALATGGTEAPDIYCAEAAFVTEYTQGIASAYAVPYAELGINIDKALEDAQIANYSVEIGTNTSGDVVALGYQGTGGAFIYRRSIAKDVWGTDDPAFIKEKIGGGSGSWDQFFIAAEELKAKGYGIISGDGDMWHAVENSADTGWVVNGKLNIDPKREEFLDLAKKLKDNGYHNDTQDWTEAWYADMRGEGEKEVFGYLGPAWLVNFTIAPNCGGDSIGEGTYGDWAICESPISFFWGGTWLLANKDSKVKGAVGDIIEWITLDTSETGLQYMWANGTADIFQIKDAPTSGTVMEKSNGVIDFLGGQNMYESYLAANTKANGSNVSMYDEDINLYWRDAVRQYTSDNCTREEAIKLFKQNVSDNLAVIVEY